MYISGTSSQYSHRITELFNVHFRYKQPILSQNHRAVQCTFQVQAASTLTESQSCSMYISGTSSQYSHRITELFNVHFRYKQPVLSQNHRAIQCTFQVQAANTLTESQSCSMYISGTSSQYSHRITELFNVHFRYKQPILSQNHRAVQCTFQVQAASTLTESQSCSMYISGTSSQYSHRITELFNVHFRYKQPILSQNHRAVQCTFQVQAANTLTESQSCSMYISGTSSQYSHRITELFNVNQVFYSISAVDNRDTKVFRDFLILS
ncbi:hypothetical protein DPMN_025806 [Dreissena polymorpha]|uniref:Uncharacterized protein n=1 Tax=Dreissena polymorpha TaxID=45954 RepID=A0A9D4RBZ7_DREPO|nr:hypothetical protein DPMN_025806 [Dreissena polymorpha]